MKRNLFLTITLGYATLIPINLHTCPGSSAMVQFKDMDICNTYDRPQYLSNEFINNACSDYVSKIAHKGALYGTLLGGCASFAYLCSKSDERTIKNISVATAGTLFGGGLSYLLGNVYASVQITSRYTELGKLQSNVNNLLNKSLCALGFIDERVGFLANELIGEIPTTDVFLKRKDELVVLSYGNTADPKNRQAIVSVYHLAKQKHNSLEEQRYNPRGDFYFNARDGIKKGINHLEEADKRFKEIDKFFKDFKKDSLLTQIVSNAALNNRIQFNLALYNSIKRLHWDMNVWLERDSKTFYK